MNTEKIYWYEVCFYGDEDSESPEYDAEKATSYVVKTEISDVLQAEKVVPKILMNSMDSRLRKELEGHMTAVMQVTEEEAKFFDVDDLTVRVTDQYGVYYTRKTKEKTT
ncbi:MAG: hypothetical protein IJ192_08530 [Clostridia bacterium]|nr:hypothetical protein [Clostridia bacterium]